MSRSRDREVVLGGAQSSSSDDELSGLVRLANGGLDVALAVSDGEVEDHVETKLGQLLREPGCVAVHRLAGKYLVALREDCSSVDHN